MKQEKPSVEWNIRCFHYEKRKLLYILLLVDVWTFLYNLFSSNNNKEGIELDEEEEEELILRPSLLTKKVVSHQTSQHFHFLR